MPNGEGLVSFKYCQQKKGNVIYPIRFELVIVGFLLVTILISQKIVN